MTATTLTVWQQAIIIGIASTALLALIVAAWKLQHQTWWFCCWCNHWFSDLGLKQKENPGIPEDRTSHGICPECHKVWKESEALQNEDRPKV